MNLKSLRKLLVYGLITVAGYCWGTESVGTNKDATWQDIESIQWSTNKGVSWGTSTTLDVGQTLQFKITMHKYEDGKHYGDLIKLWFDLNGDGDFKDTGEMLLADLHVVNPTANWDADKVVNEKHDFFSGQVTLTNAMVGNHSLVARVTCTESLLKTATSDDTWSHQWLSSYTNDNNKFYKDNFILSANYYQGETESRTLTVKDNKVPEPGTLALFAVAMLGMGLRRKQTTRA